MNIKPPKIPPKGLVNTRIAMKTLPHGVDVSIQVRFLGTTSAEEAVAHFVSALWDHAENQGVNWGNVVNIAKDLHADETTETRKLDLDDLQ